MVAATMLGPWNTDKPVLLRQPTCDNAPNAELPGMLGWRMQFTPFHAPNSLGLLNLRVKIQADGCPHCDCHSTLVPHGYGSPKPGGRSGFCGACAVKKAQDQRGNHARYQFGISQSITTTIRSSTSLCHHMSADVNHVHCLQPKLSEQFPNQHYQGML